MGILLPSLDARAGKTLAVTRHADESCLLTVFVRAQRRVFPYGCLEGLALEKEPSSIFPGRGGFKLLLALFCERKVLNLSECRSLGLTSSSSLVDFLWTEHVDK